MRALALLAMLAPEAGAAGKPTTIMTVLVSLGPAPPCLQRPPPRGSQTAGQAGRLTQLRRAQIDDLGWADTQIRNPYSPTPHIGQLAYEGIVLEQHHVYR